MERHKDFKLIYGRFVTQFGEQKSKDIYSAWLQKRGYNDNIALPRGEHKEKLCSVIGLEIKETELEYHVEGLIATSHVDDLNHAEDIEVSDVIPKETLESFATQINTIQEARVMGVHHSEGNPVNPEYFGSADIDVTPAEVLELNDGKFGLFVDTKLLKNDPETPGLIDKFKSKELNSFSITYDTDSFLTTDFDWVDGNLVRVLNPDTKLFGYTAASNPVNPNAGITGFGFKEFKELIVSKKSKEEKVDMAETKEETDKKPEETKPDTTEKVDEKVESKPDVSAESDKKDESGTTDDAEKKEFAKFKADKKTLEEKERLEKDTTKIVESVLKMQEVKEKVLKDKGETTQKEVPFEIKEFNEMVTGKKTVEMKEQFMRAAAVCDKVGIDCMDATTSSVLSREYKNFGVNGRMLEYKGLGITTNQNSDTDYLQSGAELQDIYDPVIYNGLNQATNTWNVLAKDDYSQKGNNQVQFTLKTAANVTAAFYTGNSVTTGNVTRLKYQTKFKKVQVGVSVDGDMIAAARGGPVSDVFAQEVMDSTIDMMAVVNAALYDEVGLETASAVIGFEYIADSAGNTSLYNLTRSTANLLAPASAGDTYINQSSTIVSMTNLRSMIRQARNEGASKSNLVFFTNPVQADMLRGKFDDSRRMLTYKETKFGFDTDLWVDGVPIYEDTDCNTDDFFCVDLETHRIGMWIPPTIERLGKTADSEEAFIKMYCATYNRAPRRMSMLYGCATS